MIKGDDGDKAVETLLRDTEQEIIKIYDEASKSCYTKLQAHLRAFERKDAEKRKLVESGQMSQDDYNKWKHGQIMIGQRWQDMVAVLAEDMVNADKLAVSVINGHIPEAYAINANYGTYQIEHGLGINTSFVLYDRHTVERLIRDDPDLLPAPRVDIPKDRQWNKRQINSQVTQAILQGEPVKTLARRIFPEVSKSGSTPHKNAVAAMRTARTAMTGAQNAGRVAAYKRAEEMGIEMLQEWVSSHDGHTRESHLDVDGEQVPVGHEFSNECLYPGDPGGPPEETYNCRCTLVPALKSLGQIKDEKYVPSERELDIEAYEEDKAAHKMSFTEWQNKRGQQKFDVPEVRLRGISQDIENECRTVLQKLCEEFPLRKRKLQQVVDFRTAYNLPADTTLDDFLDAHPEWYSVGAMFQPLSMQYGEGEKIEGPHIILIGTEEKNLTSLSEQLKELADLRDRDGWRSSKDSFWDFALGVSGTITHEYGHAIAYDCDLYRGGEHVRELEEVFQNHTRDEIQRDVSIYATSNSQEMLAESFVAHYESRLCTSIVNETMELIISRRKNINS